MYSWCLGDHFSHAPPMIMIVYFIAFRVIVINRVLTIIVIQAKIYPREELASKNLPLKNIPRRIFRLP